MARIVVVGGGFGGMSAAARLAKLGHEVTLLESGPALGGRLRGVELGGQSWPLHPETMTLPGVVRDLFKKSGRPLDRVLDLQPAGGRRHVFPDKTVLDLPMGQRSGQHDAVTAAFGEDRWSPWVDAWDGAWDAMRRSLLDHVPTRERDLPKHVRRLLEPRRTLKKSVKSLKDEWLEAIVLDRVTLDDSDPRLTPAVAAAWHYVERNFGLWRFDGGNIALADALTTRLDERKVDVRTGVMASDVTSEPRPIVTTDDGPVEADLVVWCASRLPTSMVPPGMPVVPARRTFIAVDDDAPELPDETVIHDRWAIRVFTAGPKRWAIEHRAGEDPLVALARNRIDFRDHVTERFDLDPSDLAGIAHWGWSWFGFGSLFRRPGTRPTNGLYIAGALGPFGASLEEVGMGTAAIAAHIGKA